MNFTELILMIYYVLISGHVVAHGRMNEKEARRKFKHLVAAVAFILSQSARGTPRSQGRKFTIGCQLKYQNSW